MTAIISAPAERYRANYAIHRAASACRSLKQFWKAGEIIEWWKEAEKRKQSKSEMTSRQSA